jgi:hypothetical protein
MFDRDGMFHCLVAVIILGGALLSEESLDVSGRDDVNFQTLSLNNHDELQDHEKMQDVND